MLPTYEQAADEVRDQPKPSALSWFIVEHEPGEVVAQTKFRRELTALVSEVETAAALRQQAFMERKASKETDDREEELLDEIEFLQAVISIKTKVQLYYGICFGIAIGGALCFLMTFIFS